MGAGSIRVGAWWRVRSCCFVALVRTLLPLPREWTAEGQLWVQYVSSTPATRLDVINLQVGGRLRSPVHSSGARSGCWSRYPSPLPPFLCPHPTCPRPPRPRSTAGATRPKAAAKAGSGNGHLPHPGGAVRPVLWCVLCSSLPCSARFAHPPPCSASPLTTHAPALAPMPCR